MEVQTDTRRIERVMLACIQCRSRHVKCDSNQPACNRCRRDGKECNYQKSRRGGLSKDALARRRLRLQQEAEQANQNSKESASTDDATTHYTSKSSSEGGDENVDSGPSNMPSLRKLRIRDHPESVPSETLTFQVSDDRLTDLFYEYFWSAFPIVLPQQFFQSRSMVEGHGIEELSLVIQWIGSLYVSYCPSDPYYQAAFEAISSPLLPRTPFNVQAIMLFAITQHHQTMRRESRETLDFAILLALELDMHTRDFARLWGEGNPVLEESWRRTWYMLSVTDQHFAIVMNTPVYQLAGMPSDVELPCDDEHYITARIPTPHTYQEMEAREFSELEIVYSSIAYLHDLCRTIANVMRTFTASSHFSRDLVDTMDTKVAIWQSLLPSTKRDPLRRDGTVDEVMFQAHMYAAMSVLMLMHRPFSSLAYMSSELTTSSFTPPVPFAIASPPGRSLHTARALRAADMQTKLLAIPCSIEKHSVFSMCLSAEIATAQVSACNHLLEDHALDIARDRVKLSIGFLSAMGSIWPLGKDMARDVRAVARLVLSVPSSLSTVQQSSDSDEIEVTRDELIWPVYPSANVDIYSGLELPMDWEGYASSALVCAGLFPGAGGISTA